MSEKAAYFSSMGRHRKKLPPAQLALAKSWRGQALRDGFTNVVGLVCDVEQDEEGIYLCVRFVGEQGDRHVYLEPRLDKEFVSPDAVGRYERLTPEELQRLRKRS